jgi:hypothetical protein
VTSVSRTLPHGDEKAARGPSSVAQTRLTAQRAAEFEGYLEGTFSEAAGWDDLSSCGTFAS